MNGVFILSLDYELFWGMQDVTSLDKYGSNILGTYTVIPKLLDILEEYGVHSTWATVGMMHAKNVEELKQYMPEYMPTYDNPKVSSYRCLKKIKCMNGSWDKFFFAPEMISKIVNWGVEGVEISSHTFSHYYCDETGQTFSQFKADLDSDKKIRGKNVSSVIFPRNHSRSEYVKILKENNIISYRGLEENWIQRVRPAILMRALRLMDTYFPLTNTNEYFPIYEDGSINLRGSRLFKPYNTNLSLLEGIKVKRIKGQMLKAAKEHKVFHLWLHPHNIGVNQEKNLKQIEEIFWYFNKLNDKYGMLSMNMKEAADYYRSEYND